MPQSNVHFPDAIYMQLYRDAKNEMCSVSAVVRRICAKHYGGETNERKQ